jgi:small subunit ribosomal protein S19e
MGYYDVPAEQLILLVAEELKKHSHVKAPSWASFVKTGVNRERPPTQKDWWQIRAASMLRRIGMIGPVGTAKLSNHYGGAKNMGHQPERFKSASTNITRKLLQQLEKANLIKHGAKGVHKGRMITPSGHSLLDKAANELAKKLNITIPKTPPAPTAEEVAAQKEAKKAATANKKVAKKAPAPEAEAI